MRVAALYDVHGNLPALEAVLAEMREAQVDEIVIGGDVLPGPMSRETIKRLLDVPVPVQFIQGNGEREVLACMAGQDIGNLPDGAQEAIRWTAKQIPPEYERFLRRWPQTVRLRMDEIGDALFCHATPRSDSEIFTRRTAESQLSPLFESVDVPIVVCGHTHMQFDRMVGRVRVVNAGSVGMPFGEPGAYWLLLGRDVQLRRTLYDLDDATRRIRATEYPQAQSFAENSVLHPPSESQMLAVFRSVELRG